MLSSRYLERNQIAAFVAFRYVRSVKAHGCHRTIDIGPDAFLFSAEIIEKADNPYVRVALEIGLYGTGTHGSVREARERTSKRTREKDVDESRGERVEAQGERFRVRFRTLRCEYLAFCNVAYLL
jgi:hypothetical protein